MYRSIASTIMTFQFKIFSIEKKGNEVHVDAFVKGDSCQLSTRWAEQVATKYMCEVRHIMKNPWMCAEGFVYVFKARNERGCSDLLEYFEPFIGATIVSTGCSYVYKRKVEAIMSNGNTITI